MTLFACGSEDVGVMSECVWCGGHAPADMPWRGFGGRYCSEDCQAEHQDDLAAQAARKAALCDWCEERPEMHARQYRDSDGLMKWWLHKYEPRELGR